METSNNFLYNKLLQVVDKSSNDAYSSESIHRHVFRLLTVFSYLNNSKKIIDIGCGPGYLSFLLNSACTNIESYIGIDNDDIFVKNKLWQNDDISTFYLSDVLTSNFTHSCIDSLVAIEFIEHLTKLELECLINKIFQKNITTIIITTPNNHFTSNFLGFKDFKQRNPGHKFEFVKADFIAFCDNIHTKYRYRYKFEELNTHYPIPFSFLAVFTKI